MTWADFVRKVTSRKFWVAVVGFVTPLMVAFGYGEDVVTQAAAIIMAGGTLIAYIVGEGLVDAARAETQEEGEIPGNIISIISPDDEDEEDEEE